MLTILDRLVTRAERAVERIDELAVGWLMRRTDLSRPLALGLLERLAQRTGAKVETSELPG